MSDDRTAFLAAIREAPEDDAVRLVFADWLEDHGDDERAEFIRSQVTASRLDDLDPTRIRLDHRAAALLKQNEKKWLTPVRRIAQSCRMDRGFPRHVVVNSRKFREKGAALFALEPIWSVRPTALRADKAHLSELMAGLAGVRELTLANLSGIATSLAIAEWRKIFTHPALESVQTLVLENNSIPITTWRTIFECPYLGNVQRLVLGQDLRGGTRHLAATPNPSILASIREVHFLLETWLRPETVATWAERLPWPQLTHLTLPRVMPETAPSCPTTHLRSFRAIGYGQETEEPDGFFGETTWPALERLELTHLIRTHTLGVLGDSRLFPRLRILLVGLQRPYHLIDDRNTSANLRSWAQSPLIGQLEELDIDWGETTYRNPAIRADIPSPFPAQFLAALFARRTPLRLRKLVLRSAGLNAETLMGLTLSGVLPELQGITFERCELPQTAAAILAQTTLPKLRALGLPGSLLGEDISPLVERFGEDGVRREF
jgi:uncharacterized protein (TIGR02996 family)